MKTMETMAKKDRIDRYNVTENTGINDEYLRYAVCEAACVWSGEGYYKVHCKDSAWRTDYVWDVWDLALDIYSVLVSTTSDMRDVWSDMCDYIC